MAACTWNTLIGARSAAGSIKRWVVNDSIDPEEIIAETEEWLNTRLRLSRMKKYLPAVAVALDQSSIDLTLVATDFLDPIQLWVNGYGEIDNVPDFDLSRFRQADTDGALNASLPLRYSVIGTTLYFDTKADQAYSLDLLYYARVPSLSESNLTNLWVERYRQLFRYAAEAQAYDFLKDETRALDRMKKAEGLAQLIEANDDLGMRGMVTYTEVA